MAKHSISCMGDSLTHNYTLGVNLFNAWPSVLQKLLVSLGHDVTCRNFGHSGNTTTQMIARFADMTTFGVPDIGIIFGGVNDSSGTQANLQTMIESLKSSGCSKIIIVSTQYQNFSVGGDTLSTPVASYATIRTAQQAAATVENVAYCDLYNFLRNRIVNGQDVQGDHLWHVADGNQHFSTYGWSLVAQCVLATIQAQGWDSTLN